MDGVLASIRDVEAAVRRELRPCGARHSESYIGPCLLRHHHGENEPHESKTTTGATVRWEDGRR